MSQFFTIADITQEAAPVFVNELAFTKAVNRSYDSRFAKTGAKIGNQTNVRIPPRYTVSEGPALDLQESVETWTPVILKHQSHVDIPWASIDWTLSVDDARERFIRPAMIELANKVDFTAQQELYKYVANHVGTPGALSGYTTTQQATSYVAAAKRRLKELGAPNSNDLSMLIDPESEQYLTSLFTNMFNPAGVTSKVFTSGAIRDNFLGFNWASSANTPAHTYGTYVQGTSPAITASAAFSGNLGPGTDRTASYNVTIVLAGAGTQTLTAGTTLTFANVYDVNPRTRQSTRSLKQFVLTADVTFNGTSAVSAAIWPAPVFTGAFQNATSTTNTIASGAAVTVPVVTSGATYGQNLAFHPSAFTLATADLELVQDGATSARTRWEGISMRSLKTYVPESDQLVLRLDVLWGAAVIYGEMAVRATT